jgi:hypothetical protein
VAPKLALVAVLGLLVLPATAAATTRYATPAPDVVHDCSQLHPCSLIDAMQNVGQNNDEVIVLPGTYTLNQNGLSTKDGMNVHGLDGAPRPVINNASSIGLGAIGSGSTVRYLEVTSPGAGTGGGAALDVQNGSTADNVIAEGLAGNSPNGCQTEGGAAATATFRNSVCKADGAGAAVSASDSLDQFDTVTLRNVTALSTSGAGILATNLMSKSVIVNAVNTIARGGTFDAQAGHFGSAAANVNLSYSNYSSHTGNDASAVVSDQGHNQSTPPQLTGDFHEQVGSPTIDAGVNDAANGSTDFDGDSRSLGSGVTDIGADEYVPAPLVTTNDPTGVGQTTATLNGTVNPESRDTTYHFDFGTTTAYGSSTPTTGVGSGTAPIAVNAPLNPIVPGTTYHYRIVATNSVGTSFGADRQFTTAAVPSFGSTPGGPSVTPPPPFAGLVLHGQTLTVGTNGKVTLNVPCPAAALGNCTGTDTLKTTGPVSLRVVAAKAKKKKAKVLTLGHAHFSIAPGKTGKVTIKLSKTAFKYLKKKHKLKVLEIVVAHDSRNVAKTSQTKITLKAPKAKKEKKH